MILTNADFSKEKSIQLLQNLSLLQNKGSLTGFCPDRNMNYTLYFMATKYQSDT